jgi:AcrR family transcriptional regulator
MTMAGLREIQKSATRARVLKAARALFQERVFDEVGVREIAVEAGVATGTVIGAFGSKGELLNAIVIEDCLAQVPEMQAQAAQNDDTRAALMAIVKVPFDYHMAQLPILRATMADSWMRSAAAEKKVRRAVAPLFVILGEVLERGVARGEIAAGTDLRVLAELICESLLNAYRDTVFSEVPPDALWKRVETRLTLLAPGVMAVATVAPQAASAAA